MKGILYAQFKLLMKKPTTFLLMTGLMIIFAFFIGNGNGTYSPHIPVYSQMDASNTDKMIDKLTEYGTQNFDLVEMEELERAVREGDAEAGLVLYDDHYEFVISSEQPTFVLLEQNVKKAYSSFLLEERLLQADSVNGRSIIKELTEPMFMVETKTFVGEDSFIYDGKLQAIFGFAVFFVIYTIAFNVIQILTAKRLGIWDRFILSPAKKWEMYLGILCYAFLLGYIQVVLVFSIFKYALGVNFYGGYGKTLILLIPYVLCIVSLSVLLAGISKTIQTFNALIPLFAVSLAMIGGAYWPIEIVSNKFMLTLAKIDPIAYVMNAFKSVTIYGEALSSALFPVSILLLMSVVMMGVGLNLMERRD